MKVTKNSLYVYKLPDGERHRFYIATLDDPYAKECKAECVAGPFGVMFGNITNADNGWEDANTWIRLNDRVAHNFILNGKPIWNQIETIVEGVSTFSSFDESWHSWIVVKWPEKLPENFPYQLNEEFADNLIMKFSLNHYTSYIPGQRFADRGHIQIDKDRQLILLTQMGGLDI